jgi:hypothetical protein
MIASFSEIDFISYKYVFSLLKQSKVKFHLH